MTSSVTASPPAIRVPKAAQYHRLGRTGLQVSAVGMGTWGMARNSWADANDRNSLRALCSAHDAGINFFDTALAYGEGRVERLLAQALGNAPDVIIATKVPPRNRRWPARHGVPLRQVFPREHVLACLEQSLRNLSRDAIDLYQFHVWSDEWAGSAEWQETIYQIRRQGKARFIGISVNDHQANNVLQALATGLVDVVQVIYNIFDQSANEALLPYCQAHDIGVIVRVPFDESGLTGHIRPDTVFPQGDFRNHYFAGVRKRKVWQRSQRLAADFGIPLEHLPTLALRFCLASPVVSTVIPGMRSPEHVRDNLAVLELPPLDARELLRLKEHRWPRNFYHPSLMQRLSGLCSLSRHFHLRRNRL